jgi:GNAT superfamily N-acetyltransferase
VPQLAEATEARRAAEILARAFLRDPVLLWLLREGPDRGARMARYFELECEFGSAGHGEVWLDDDGLGAAIWRGPGGYPEPLSARLRMLPHFLRLFPREFVRASRAMTALARVHPREPHWYLLAVGVVPGATGQGRGSALLEPVLTRCDADGLPAYLEASTADNIRLYERLGFGRREEVEIFSGVRVLPMWREPS